MLISVWMHECIQACGSFSLVGHCVAFVSQVIACGGVSQDRLGFVDPSVDAGLASRCADLTFVELRLTLVHDSATLVRRWVGMVPIGFVGGAGFIGKRFIRVHCVLRSIETGTRRPSSIAVSRSGQRR